MLQLIMYIMYIILTNQVIYNRWRHLNDTNISNIINSNDTLSPPWWQILWANHRRQCGPDCLKFLWIMADHAAQTQYGFSLDDIQCNDMNEHSITSQQAIDYRRVRGKKYHENRLRLLTHIFEAITERIIGVTSILSNSNVYKQWLDQIRHNWLPTYPLFDLSSQTSHSFLGSSLDTMSASLSIESERNLIPDCTDSQRTAHLLSQNVQSSSLQIGLSSSLHSSHELIINERVGGYRRDRDQRHRTPSSDLLDAAASPLILIHRSLMIPRVIVRVKLIDIFWV